MRFGRMSLEELVGALLFLFVGLYVIWESYSYPMGSLRAMGPGYFPYYLGVLLSGLSVVHIAERVFISADEHRSAAWRWRPAIAVVAALLAFAFMFKFTGIVPAIFVMVFISGLGHDDMHPWHLLFVAIGLSIFAYVVFIWGLTLPLTPFGRLPFLSELN